MLSLLPTFNIALVFFRSSTGYWHFYAAIPPGPSPIKCSPDYEWCLIAPKGVKFKGKKKRVFS